MKKIINRLFIMTLAMVIVISFIPCELNVKATDDDIINVTISGTENYDYAFEMLDILNEIREKAGLRPFHMDKNDLEDCMQRAAELSVYYSHTRPDGKEGLGMETCACKQNTPQEAVTAWMNSPKHHDILMTPSFGTGMYDKDKFYAIGAGCFMDTEGQYYWIFGSTARLETTFVSELEYNRTKNVTKTIPCIKSRISETGWSMFVDEQLNDREYTYGETKQIPYRMTTQPYSNASPLDYSNFTVTSTNSSVAKVNDDEHYISLGNAGTATIRATLRDDESIYFERKITVIPKNITEWDCSFPKGRLRYDYSGEVIKPQVTVDPWFGTPLTPNQDYTVKYTDLNGVECNPKEIGKYKCIIEGKGNYTGTCELEWGIYKCSHKETANKIQHPTCTEDGFENTICVNCKENLNSVKIRAKDHRYTSKVTKSATCNATGVKTYTCLNCNDSYTESIPVTGHKFSEWTTDTPNTCVTGGIRTRKCSYCNKVETSTVPAMGHKYSSSWTIDKAATCSSEGSKSHHCTICGDKKDITAIPKTSHKYTSKITKSATCTSTGIKTYTCSGCSNNYTESIPATGHKFSEWTTDTPNTCVTGGTRTRKCSNCNKVETSTVPATGHKYSSSWTIDKAATCSSVGSKSHHCTICGDKKDITSISQLSHKYDDGTIKVQPTCTNTGIKSYTCKDCGNIKTENINKTSHNYIVEITKEPTCIEVGEKNMVCSMCNESHTESLLKKGHNYTDTVVNPSYTSNGYTIHTCSACGETYKDSYKNKLTLAKVSGLNASSGTNSVKLSWSKVKDADGYIVYRYDNSKKAWVRVAKTKTTATSYTVSKLKAGTTYKFAVKAYKNADKKEVTSQKYPQLNTSTNPENITKSNFKSSVNTVKMSWSKVTGATGYRVYKYNTSTKKWQTIANTKNTSYTFSELKTGTTYKFTVRAYKTLDGKTYLSPKYTTFTSSTNPTLVSFKVTGGSKKATVKWSKVTGATNYKIYYKTSSKGKWQLLKTASNKTTSYTKTKLSSKKTYWFKVDTVRKVSGKTYTTAGSTKSVKIK